MPVDPAIAGLLTFLANANYPPLSQGTPESARAGMRTLLVDLRDASTLPEVGSINAATVADSVPVRVYRPKGAGRSSVPTVVYFHGGGWVIGDLDTHDGLCRLLCNDVEAVVVSVDYRLAPVHPFPAAADDSYAALRHIAEHIEDFGADRHRLAVAGDSAGGNLAAVCAQQAHADGLELAAQLLVYPAVDMLGEYRSRTDNADGYFLTLDDMRWFARNYVGFDEDDPRVGELARDPRISPLHAPVLDGLAPAVVVTAEYDPLRDEGNAYAALLEQAGVRVQHRQFPGLVHGFYGMEAISPAAAEAMTWTNHRLKEMLG